MVEAEPRNYKYIKDALDYGLVYGSDDANQRAAELFMEWGKTPDDRIRLGKVFHLGQQAVKTEREPLRLVS